LSVKDLKRKDLNGDGLPDFVCLFGAGELIDDDLLVDNKTLDITGEFIDGQSIPG
jgi:hypothetical protein